MGCKKAIHIAGRSKGSREATVPERSLVTGRHIPFRDEPELVKIISRLYGGPAGPQYASGRDRCPEDLA